MKRIFIGGEHYFSPGIIFSGKTFTLKEYLEGRFPGMKYFLTLGGLSSLSLILESLNIAGDKTVLLPSYLCPDILIPFKKFGIKYYFYKVNGNLVIDIADLLNKVNGNIAAVLFINYFGFPQRTEVLNALNSLKEKGIVIIEDAVHSFFSEFETTGDYIFNSFRKFLPVDGGIVLSNKSLTKRRVKSNCKYTLYRNTGRLLRGTHINCGFPSSSLFLKLFKISEKNYCNLKPSGFPWMSRLILSKQDIPGMIDKRKSIYKKLLEEFGQYALYKTLPEDVVPLGSPVLVENRDKIRKKLINKNIFCPVHWSLPDEVDRNNFPGSYYLSERILTIPVNERMDDRSIDYLSKSLRSL